jgi:hypothetical protein
VPGARRIKACGVAMTKIPRRGMFVLDRHKGKEQTRCTARVPPKLAGLTDRAVAENTSRNSRRRGAGGLFPFFSRGWLTPPTPPLIIPLVAVTRDGRNEPTATRVAKSSNRRPGTPI